MTVFIHYNLYSFRKLRKVKLYLNTWFAITKIVMPNRVKNESIFNVASVKPFSRDKSTCPNYFALVYNQGILLSRFFIGRFSVCHSCQLVHTETGEKNWVDTSIPEVRRYISKQIDFRSRKLESELKRINAGFVLLNTSEDFVKPLHYFFKNR